MESVKAMHFSQYKLPEHYPTVRQSTGSGPSFVSLAPYGEAPPTLYIRGDLSSPFVQPAVYGDKDTQTDLRAKVEEGANLKVVSYFSHLWRPRLSPSTTS